MIEMGLKWSTVERLLILGMGVTAAYENIRVDTLSDALIYQGCQGRIPNADNPLSEHRPARVAAQKMRKTRQVSPLIFVRSERNSEFFSPMF